LGTPARRRMIRLASTYDQSSVASEPGRRQRDPRAQANTPAEAGVPMTRTIVSRCAATDASQARSEPPSRSQPGRLRVLDLADIEDLVLGAQRESLEDREADTPAVNGLCFALIEDDTIVPSNLELVRHPSSFDEQLQRPYRQCRDERRRGAPQIRLAFRQIQQRGAVRLVEVEVVELKCERTIHTPPDKGLGSVGVLIEIDTHVVEAVDVGREIAEPDAEIKTRLLIGPRRSRYE